MIAKVAYKPPVLAPSLAMRRTEQFSGSADFGGGTLTAPAGLTGASLAEYMWAGAYRCAGAFTRTGLNTGYGVAVDGGNNVIVTGALQTTTDFGGRALTSAGAADSFRAKYSSPGVLQWAHGYGSTSDDTGYGVAVGGSGNVVATGTFQRTVDFGLDLLTSAGPVDLYVTKVGPCRPGA